MTVCIPWEINASPITTVSYGDVQTAHHDWCQKYFDYLYYTTCLPITRTVLCSQHQIIYIHCVVYQLFLNIPNNFSRHIMYTSVSHNICMWPDMRAHLWIWTSIYFPNNLASRPPSTNTYHLYIVSIVLHLSTVMDDILFQWLQDDSICQ